MSDSFIQVRTNEADKLAAAAILEELGTNTSAVVNMLLKQIIQTRGIPFDVKLSRKERKISQYRVEDLKKLLAVVPESVDEIWVFGSTVTEHCRPQSDLDICVVGNTTMQEESIMYKSTKCAVDIITATPKEFAEWQKTNGSVYKDVVENGLLVYKKGADIKWQ